MAFRYKKFSSLAFLTKPQRLTLEDKWNIEYLGFCLPQNQGKPPVVFLGGAFQTFFSFKKDVQMMMEEHPIILVDLPSQGSNTQLSEELVFEDFARLLKGFIDQFDIEKITPIGLSYGSATAFYFASLYPERTHKVILGGTTPRVRESYRLLLNDTFHLLDTGDMQVFSQGAVLNLINYSKRHLTKIPERIIKGFYKNMIGLSNNDKERYRINTQRLLNLDGVVGNPKSPTLVMTGEYDNFTTPYENFLVAQQIENAIFALVKDGDHLANLEKRDTVIDGYLHFLSDRPISEVPGIEIVTSEDMLLKDRRLDQRLRPENPRAWIKDARSQSFECEIEDINYNGCQLKLGQEIWKSIDLSGHISIELEEAKELELTAHLLQTPLKNERVSCVFRRGNFEQGQLLESYIERLQQ